MHVAGGARTARKSVVVQARKPREPSDVARVGFTATKRIGGAVIRNRAKRRLRHAARLLVPVYGRRGTDYVFVARADTVERPWSGLLDDVKSALIRLGSDADREAATDSGGRSSPSN